MYKTGIRLASMVMLLVLAGCSAENSENTADRDKPDAAPVFEVVQADYPEASTDQVIRALKQGDAVVVDTRLNDAFNGWRLDGISRGGHIKGAVDFSANWLRVKGDDSAAVLGETLVNKGLSPNKQVILYDANGQDARQVADYLRQQGFAQLSVYDLKSWADDTSLPMERYPNYQLIVPASIVKALLDGQRPETFEQAQTVKIVEASWGEEKTSYSKGHVPTAFHINTDDIEPPTTEPPMMWLLADDATLQKVAVKYGFTKDDTVIVTSEEPLAAYRVATVLRYIGVRDVRVLNGGLSAWVQAGYSLETASNSPQAVADFGAPVPGRPDVFDTMDEVRAGLKNPERFTLVDNRTWDEFVGKSSGYSYHDKKGRIPGAVFGYAGKTNSYALDYFRNPDKTMRNAQEILELWRGQGIDFNKHLSFMCGSGWRVAEVYTYADVMGLKDISIFSDGWIGWSNNPDNPTISGEPGQ